MQNSKENTQPVPGGVYLCQVNESVSCGACCGLYNVKVPSFKALQGMLARRTADFDVLPRTMDAILDFQTQTEATACSTRPLPDFHHCAFLGLVGKKRSRVGCLLHPMNPGNNGMDFRGLSFYGGLACNAYFCPSYHQLSASVKQIVTAVSTDWYTYGLVITEAQLLEAFFSHVEARIGRPLVKKDVLGNPEASQGVRDFLSLKLTWPYRKKDSCALIHYFFKDGLYQRPPVDYPSIAGQESRYDVIFRQLHSFFESALQLHQAEALLDRMVEGLAENVLRA
ncbi:MAG: hypothetical protein JRI36_04815 [Deltaproteobacteria bacterium]|nr:hypothetical protein [Deltaproteobacteria bacterium]